MKAILLSLLLPSLLLGISVPFLSGPVVDDAHLLSSQQFSEVESAIRTLREKRGVQLSVLIVASLQGSDIETFSMQVAEAWKLGKKKEDRGLLFVVAPTDRRMRLEVGYGLEGEIPDAIAKRILREAAGPYFKKNAYAEGILATISQIDAHIENPKQLLESENNPQPSKPIAGTIFILLLFGVMCILSFFRRALYGSHYSNRSGWDRFGGGGGFGGWGGGSGGGGGWSGGGGGFGGGGSSDSW